MKTAGPEILNPCTLGEHELIPAKVWELLRRNDSFRSAASRLERLHDEVLRIRSENGEFLNEAWHDAHRFLERVKVKHPFGGIALEWLVPEPLFQVRVVTVPKGQAWRKGFFTPRELRLGEGTTPEPNDKDVWRWFQDSREANRTGRRWRRGPLITWTTSKHKGLRDHVNPLEEWKRFKWPFTVDHDWTKAPIGFKREVQFQWRRNFDCRAKNPITNSRDDSRFPHEVSRLPFWTDADVLRAKQVQGLSTPELTKIIATGELLRDYRVFAIPKTILTKRTAADMGEWLSDELRKGNDTYGSLLVDGLLNEAELLGTTDEWADFLRYRSNIGNGVVPAQARRQMLLSRYTKPGDSQQVQLEKTQQNQSHCYRRLAHMNRLVDTIYPMFDIASLLERPSHRRHGKKLVRKGSKK
jgi:hypothetical protein